MNTENVLRRTQVESATPESIGHAADIIKRGGLVAFPTETVYGLGANGLDGAAVEQIYKAKGRPADNPLILHIAHMEQVYELAASVSFEAQKLIETFWPGALTLILPKRCCIPDVVSCGLSTVGLRMPAHPVAKELILAAGLPIAAPSANLSGRPSPTLAEHVVYDLDGKIDMILDGGSCDWGLESTVAEIVDGGVCVLRPGAVTLEQIKLIISNVWTHDSVLTGNADSPPKSPGMKYRHYSPEAEVILVTGTENKVAEYILTNTTGNGNTGILATDQTIARYSETGCTVLSLGDREHAEYAAANLFRILREFDARGINCVYAEGVNEHGLGLAVMNRLRKASAIEEIIL